VTDPIYFWFKMTPMETIQLSGKEGIVSIRAAAALRSGGVILYPTDTLYGLGADAFSDTAVDKVYAIKGRDASKAMHAVFSDMNMVAEYAEVNDIGRILADKFLPGPLTIVFKKKPEVAGGIARKMQTIGVRIPDNVFCIETARALGKPFTATSANVAQNPVLLSIEEIIGQMGTQAEEIDLVIDAGMLPLRPPSTVVSVASGHIEFLRIGAIPRSEIESALN
jgi:L-threonylcarbamoyladenylate synthase